MQDPVRRSAAAGGDAPRGAIVSGQSNRCTATRATFRMFLILLRHCVAIGRCFA
jgi:hypothetical protein